MVVWDLGNHLKLKSMPDSFHDSDREMSPGTVTVTVMCNGLKSYLEEYSCFWLLTCHFTYCKVANSSTFWLVTPVDLFNKSLQNAPIWGPSRACVQAGPVLYHVINRNTRTWDCGNCCCCGVTKPMGSRVRALKRAKCKKDYHLTKTKNPIRPFNLHLDFWKSRSWEIVLNWLQFPNSK